MVLPQITVPNLVDPSTYAEHDLDAVWRHLRHTDPVYRHPATADGPGFWVVSRYEDIARVLRDDEGFTSEQGNVLATMLHGGDTGAGRMLAVTDGQHHTELRKLLIRPFAPRAMAGVADRVRRLTRRLLTDAAQRGECDFARDIASAIPLQTICDLLDVPAADRDEVLRLTKSALASDYGPPARPGTVGGAVGVADPDGDAARIARGEIVLYFSDLLAERRKRPGDDPISLMATTDVGGRRLGDEDIILNCYSLIMGGDETSRLSMIGAVRAFIEHPGQWSALRDGSVTVDSAVEEVLRWTTPTMHFGRTATAAGTIGDRPVAAGDLVTLWFTSANRDETVFPDADRFDVARSPNRHLSFGHGRHFCLGAHLGRVEIHAMLDALRTLVRAVDQTGPARPLYSNFLSGTSSLPVRLTADPTGSSRWRE